MRMELGRGRETGREGDREAGYRGGKEKVGLGMAEEDCGRV